MKTSVELVATGTWFYAPGDEDAFFHWLGQIRCVGRPYGVADKLVIPVANKKISDACLRELLALFWRYDIEMGQLKVFENNRNKKWFRDRTKYWYDNVFCE